VRIVFRELQTLEGASELVRPVQGGAANAIGAAIAQTSGTVDRVFSFSDADGRKKAFAKAEEEARRACLAAGATRESVRQRGAVVERSETPLPYMAPDAVRIRVRVVGELDLSGNRSSTAVYSAKSAKAKATAETATDKVDQGDRVLLPMPGPRARQAVAVPPPELPVSDVSKTAVDAHGDWLLRPADVDALALGAGILAAGGGGNATRPALAIRAHMLEQPGVALRVRALRHLDDEAVVLSGTTMGAPLVAVEKLMTDKMRVAGDAVSAARGVIPTALLCLEIGGGNGMELLYWSLLSGATVDAAWRSIFPQLFRTSDVTAKDS
jgi:hypothetical protein